MMTIAGLIVAACVTVADAQTFRPRTAEEVNYCRHVEECLPPPVPGPAGPRGPEGPQGPKGDPGPGVELPPVVACDPLPALDLPLTTPTWIEPGGCASYVLGYLGTTAYLVDLRERRYQALPAPLSGHAMTATSASRVDPWLVMASDATGLWLVRVTPTPVWKVLP
jgi:hypothetical protein